jgi:hypothetical protein
MLPGLENVINHLENVVEKALDQIAKLIERAEDRGGAIPIPKSDPLPPRVELPPRVDEPVPALPPVVEVIDINPPTVDDAVDAVNPSTVGEPVVPVNPGDTAAPAPITPIAAIDLAAVVEATSPLARAAATSPAPPPGPDQAPASPNGTAPAPLAAGVRAVEGAVEAAFTASPAPGAEEDDGSAAYLELVEGQRSAAGSLLGADLAPAPNAGLDLQALDLALQQVLAGVERIGQGFAEHVSKPGLFSWITGALASLLALEVARRYVQQRRARLVAGSLTNDPALTWVPGMPGSFSVDEDA